ncbi:hypothetical protein B0H13DRAFT_1891572 [Mycena leptocephala]|nr:hypothetical protein B0H13DRAFT_1891572 [Mycena leptocephala]
MALAGNLLTAPVLAQTSTSDPCASVCQIGNTTVGEAVGLDQIAKCLDCQAVTGPGASFAAVPTFQIEVDDLVNECNQNGHTVHNATVDGAYKSGKGGGVSTYACGNKGLLAVAGIIVLTKRCGDNTEWDARRSATGKARANNPDMFPELRPKSAHLEALAPGILE